MNKKLKVAKARVLVAKSKRRTSPKGSAQESLNDLLNKNVQVALLLQKIFGNQK